MAKNLTFFGMSNRPLYKEFWESLSVYIVVQFLKVSLHTLIWYEVFLLFGYHPPFWHKELVLLRYMTVALRSDQPEIRSDRDQSTSMCLRPEEPFLLLKYILTQSLILSCYYSQSLSCKYSSCKYNYFLTYRGLSYYYYYLCSLTRTQHLSNTNNLHTFIWFQVFLSNTNNYIVLSYYFYFIIIICLQKCYVVSSKRIEKSMEHENNGDFNCNCRVRYCHQRIGTETRGLGNKETSGCHPNYSIVEIGQNTKKSPGVLRRLAVTQTSVENYQLARVWKTQRWVK